MALMTLIFNAQQKQKEEIEESYLQRSKFTHEKYQEKINELNDLITKITKELTEKSTSFYKLLNENR